MENRIFTTYAADGKASLGQLCTELLEEQKKTWPALVAAYVGLDAVQTRKVVCSGYETVLQFNPARIVSSGAAVDRQSIQNRPCFLCIPNLPGEQKGIVYQEDYLILCNPAPVFKEHFTVVHLRHQPQAVASSMNMLLDITADMSPDFVVFYNGPACGASAPDHLHFQAIPAGILPLLNSFSEHFRIIRDASVRVYCGQGISRAAVVLAGDDKKSLLEYFDHLIKSAQNIMAAGGEPMINVLCSYEDGVWRIMIFFRAKHRPDAFYREDEQRVFVSPGAIDMAGVVIAPLKVDFNRLDGEVIDRIYAEVSLPEETMNEIINKL